ncbi:MAG: N-acetylmuramoyl-L-alanine amidase [Hyphomicrobiaceae bacterium]
MRSLVCRLIVVCAVIFGGVGTASVPAGAQGSTHVKTMPAPPPEVPAPATISDPRSDAPSPHPYAAPVGPVVADGASATGDHALTRFALELTGPVEYQVFRLPAPDRVVIDVSNVEFSMPAAVGRNGAGLVRAFRFGAFAPGKARVVVETAGPVRVEATRLIREGARGRHRLELDLLPSRSVQLSEHEVAAARESAARLRLGDAASAPPEPAQKRAPAAPRLPVIVIDPGHGGVDPGAQGAVAVEKDIVLAVGRELERALVAAGRYRVVMTRAGDAFVPLERRIRIAREHEAQLFVSLHADSLEARDLAHSVRGATIYTLSQSASDERARQLADKENAADLLAGAHLTAEVFQDDVKSILFDLMARETAGLSLNFRQLAAKRLRGNIHLSRDPQRAANFLVLRQAETPAVLIELGYISHVEEEREMLSEEWQRKVAAAITAAINDFFASSGSIFR